MQLHRTSATIILLLCLMFQTGCIQIPIGSKVGRESVVGVRTNSEGQISEQIFAVPTENHVFMPFSPEGMQLNYVASETWRFYLQGEDGERKVLRFLQAKAGFAMPWDLVAPLSSTNLWIAVKYDGSSRQVEQHKYLYRLVYFNPIQKTEERLLTYPDLGTFEFDHDKRLLLYKFGTNEIAYAPTRHAETNNAAAHK